VIESQNTAEVDPSKVIQKVTATFEIAGIEFLPEDQRTAAAHGPGAVSAPSHRPGLTPRGGASSQSMGVGARP
jgi:hypothetical protein